MFSSSNFRKLEAGNYIFSNKLSFLKYIYIYMLNLRQWCISTYLFCFACIDTLDTAGCQRLVTFGFMSLRTFKILSDYKIIAREHWLTSEDTGNDCQARILGISSPVIIIFAFKFRLLNCISVNCEELKPALSFELLFMILFLFFIHKF